MFTVSDLIKDLLKKCSTQPGVYKMLDKDSQIIYVGKAKNLRKRVKSYFQKNKTIAPKVAVMRETNRQYRIYGNPNRTRSSRTRNQLNQKYSAQVQYLDEGR
jgi:excinuclease ABC subunit C